MTHHQSLLLIDDDDGARDAVAKCLIASGHRLRMAHCGLEALAAATGEAPDVVVLDLRLPVTSAIDTARALRSSDITSRTRIVICAELAEEGVRHLFPTCDAYVAMNDDAALLRAVQAA